MRILHARIASCLIFACFLSGVASATSTAEHKAVEAYVSFLSPRNHSYEWRIWNAAKGTVSTFLTSKNRPGLIFWMPSERRVYFSLGSGIYRSRYDVGAASAEYIGKLPVDVGDVRVLWVDRETRRLRAAAMVPVQDADIIRSEAGTRYRIRNGQAIPALSVPSWGLPYIATALELRNGRWTTLAHRATKSDAGETPGLTVLDTFRREDGFSNERLLESYTCATGICRNDVPNALRVGASKLMGIRFTPDELGIAPNAAERPAILFGISSGDTLHMTAPVFAVSTHNRLFKIDARKNRQLGVGLKASMALVAEEWSGNRPAVIDLQTGGVLFSVDGLEATWIPSQEGPAGTVAP